MWQFFSGENYENTLIDAIIMVIYILFWRSLQNLNAWIAQKKGTAAAKLNWWTQFVGNMNGMKISLEFGSIVGKLSLFSFFHSLSLSRSLPIFIIFLFAMASGRHNLNVAQNINLVNSNGIQFLNTALVYGPIQKF